MKKGLLLFAFVFLAACTSQTIPNQDTNYDDFAKCLTENGAAMYGATWCSHCANQKKMFGESFQYVTYVECDTGYGQTQVCANEGIRGYPTWKFKDGSKIEGEASIVDLSKSSECDLDLIKV